MNKLTKYLTGIAFGSALIGSVAALFSIRDRKEDTNAQPINEVRTSSPWEYATVLGNVALAYTDKGSVKLDVGSNYVYDASILEAKVGGKRFTLYDYVDRKRMDLSSNDPHKATIERVVIELEDGKRYEYDITDRNNKTLRGKHVRDMLGKASEIYNYQTGRVKEDRINNRAAIKKENELKEEELKNKDDERQKKELGPDSDIFDPLTPAISIPKKNF